MNYKKICEVTYFISDVLRRIGMPILLLSIPALLLCCLADFFEWSIKVNHVLAYIIMYLGMGMIAMAYMLYYVALISKEYLIKEKSEGKEPVPEEKPTQVNYYMTLENGSSYNNVVNNQINELKNAEYQLEDGKRKQ